MSELIKNREYRKKVLKEMIMGLHEGQRVEDVKARFAELIAGVSPEEISEMEQSLIMEGMPVAEVQRLCDVHAAVFKGSIDQIHHPDQVPGHPLHTFRHENRAIEQLIHEQLQPHLDSWQKGGGFTSTQDLLGDVNRLSDIDRHFSRKENLLFPYLERHGITAPPKVMWGVDDEIRDEIKKIKDLLSRYNGGNKDAIVSGLQGLVGRVLEMVFKEENILFPMAQDALSENEWASIAEESDHIGYCLSEPEKAWKPAEAATLGAAEVQPHGQVRLDTGVLTVEQIGAILDHLPIDVTFIDADNVVRYFSQGKERIFARTKAVIGRKVQNCHPPASVHIVERLLSDLRSGAKDHEDFWLRMGHAYVYIRYFAVRDASGAYLGALEVTQNIAPIQQIEGEKRLLSDLPQPGISPGQTPGDEAPQQLQ